MNRFNLFNNRLEIRKLTFKYLIVKSEKVVSYFNTMINYKTSRNFNMKLTSLTLNVFYIS
jgi:hypothetical protein